MGAHGKRRLAFRRHGAAASIVLICFALAACDFGTGRPEPLTYDEAVKRVTFDGGFATVDFSNLNRHDIYLVRINSSGLPVPGGNAGGVTQFLSGYAAVQNFNANPPPVDMEMRHNAGAAADIVPRDIGGKKNFWVEKNIADDSWEQRPAVLAAAGEHGNIWVMEENMPAGAGENIISTAQAEEMAKKFDEIYRLTTNLLGHEYGGGPDGDGGMDGDKKIQILIYDFYDPAYEADGPRYAGFFYVKDFYTQAELDSERLGWKTNLAEMFYLNARTVIDSPDFAYTTLIHEMQHMINFNGKFIKHGLNSGDWYNEMLSMLAEDVIAPLIGIGRNHPSHPISLRIPSFLNSYYRSGITEWRNFYSTAYAFGAYLVRNYGGPELLKRMLENDEVDVESVTTALKEFSEDMDFEKALDRYGEALIFSGSSMPNDIVTFDRTVTGTVNGQRYTAYGFDIWKMRRYSTEEIGPLVPDFEPASMRPHSVIIQSIAEWKNKTGNFSITLERPADQNVIFYLMAR